ncbi:MAG: uroporphyrinogen-III synthase [Bacteroidales bacterium]|nr:uroporphyrinogen-III synthase [Bacteroidales bacterium]
MKRILVSQSKPLNAAPFTALEEKFGVEITFQPFFLIEPLTSMEFRTQRINILDYTAIIFSSRHAINAFYGLCEELRIKIPETMKYFCTTEAVAMYLQKHIVYRKRKIFYGTGTAQSVIDQIGSKHKGEKFLLTQSDQSSSSSLRELMDGKGLDYSSAVFVKAVPQDLKNFDLSAYDIVVVYNPNDVTAIKTSFPDYKQGNTKFLTYGKSIVPAMEEAGLEIEVKAPTPEAPSVAKALELYLEKQI